MKSLADPRQTTDLLRRLRHVQPDTTGRWGRMSAHQMICHLADALRMALDERRVTGTASPRPIVKWIALYLPVRWPAGLPTSLELDQESSGTPPTDFAGDLQQVESLLRRLASDQARTCPTHPIFGAMSRAAWLRWAYLHTDHHLRQFGA